MIKKYLATKKELLVITLSVMTIFHLVFYLENINFGTIYYGFTLSILTIVIYLIIDYFKFVNRIRKLKNYLHNTLYQDNFNFEGENELEKLLETIVKKLLNNQDKLINNQIIQQKELIDFYTTWIHQIKTPIFALKLLIKNYSENNDLLSELSKIESYSDTALNYIKLSDEGTELSIKEYDVKDLINEVIKEFSIIFITKKLKLIIKLESHFIKTDKKWFKFALSQLISNALKYTDSGTIQIILKDNNLIIRDTGIGINAEDLPRIFDKGFTGIAGRLNKNSTGIGLYLCKKSLDLLNLNIKVNSKIKEGTTFEIPLIQKNHIFE